MDKFLSSTWFVRLLSFVIALMLFAVVSAEKDGLGNSTSLAEGDDPQQLRNVPITAVYDEEKYSLTGLPETVSVELEGANNVIRSTTMKNDYEVFVDLRGKGEGTHTVQVQFRGFPEELDVQVIPSEVQVELEQKTSETFPVQIDVRNGGQVAEGYEVGDPIVTPNRVQVTAAESAIENIAFVRGFVDVKGADETIEETVPINVYDKNGNELNVELSTSVVEVKVPVTGPSKTVPLKLSREASLPDGLSIKSIKIEPSAVTLFGPDDVLADIDFIDGLQVNLADITEDTQLELEVPVPEGVNKINPETVKVTVNVAAQEEKTIEGVPIEVIGLSDDLNVVFQDPADQTVDVTVMGSASVLDKISANDIEAYIDVSELSTGKHSVNLDINGPQNITTEPETGEVQIEITESGA